MPQVIERTVKRYFVNGKGYASRSMAYYQLAKKQILDEVREEFGEIMKDGCREDGTYDYREGEFEPDPFNNPEVFKWPSKAWVELGNRYTAFYGEDGTYFDRNAWHADIRNRAKELMERDEA